MTGTDDTTRATMLKHTIHLLETEGEQAIRVRDVASAAGVTYSAVEHHFGGREGLIEAAYVESYRQDYFFELTDVTAMFDAATTVAMFREAITSVVLANMVPSRAPARRRRAIVLGGAATRPLLAEKLRLMENDFVAGFTRMLKHPQQQGWIAPDADIQTIAAVYVGIINSRYLIEMAPGGADSATWNNYAMRAIIALTEI